MIILAPLILFIPLFLFAAPVLMAGGTAWNVGKYVLNRPQGEAPRKKRPLDEVVNEEIVNYFGENAKWRWLSNGNVRERYHSGESLELVIISQNKKNTGYVVKSENGPKLFINSLNQLLRAKTPDTPPEDTAPKKPKPPKPSSDVPEELDDLEEESDVNEPDAKPRTHDKPSKKELPENLPQKAYEWLSLKRSEISEMFSSALSVGETEVVLPISFLPNEKYWNAICDCLTNADTTAEVIKTGILLRLNEEEETE